MGYSIESSTVNCYEGTTCLINKFDIRNENKASILETDITLAKSIILEHTPIELPMDFNFGFIIILSWLFSFFLPEV